MATLALVATAIGAAVVVAGARTPPDCLATADTNSELAACFRARADAEDFRVAAVERRIRSRTRPDSVTAAFDSAAAAAGAPPAAGGGLPVGLAAGYARVRDTLRAATRVPVRVPRRVWGDAADDSLHVLVEDADAESYSVFFAVDPRCRGGSVCRDGGVTGERLAAALERPAGRTVRLRDGRRAVYVPGACGAGCRDAKLVWDDGTYQYAVGLHRGRLDQLVPMAESVGPLW